MRVTFWPDRALAQLVGPVWPWLSPDLDGLQAHQSRLQSALYPFWDQRVDAIERTMLSEQGIRKIKMKSRVATADTPGSLGYDRVAAAIADQSLAFWFFDLGCAAWIRRLDQMRRSGALPVSADDAPVLDQVEAVWRSEGALPAAAHLDEAIRTATAHGRALSPALALYRVPLAIWGEQDVQRARYLLEDVAREAPADTRAALGPHLPLTLALCAALHGDLRRAIALLADDRLRELRPSDDARAELVYHRARYEWDAGVTDTAVASLRTVVALRPAYAARVLCDAGWHDEATARGRAMVVAALGEAVNDVRNRLAKWQVSRRADETGPVVEQIEELLSYSGDEPMILLAIAPLLHAQEHGREEARKMTRVIGTDLVTLRRVANELPSDFRLRMGPGYAPRFRGPDSDMGRIDALVASGKALVAAPLIEDLLQRLPGAMKLALATHLARLANALTSSAEVLYQRGRPEDQARYETSIALAERCVKALDWFADLPTTVSDEGLVRVRKAWEAIARIERDWISSEAYALGQMKIVVGVQRPIVPGKTTALVATVVDAAGVEVAGVPILWTVQRGPAEPQSPADNIEVEWSLTQATGAAYFPVIATGQGTDGELSLSLLGGYGTVALPYVVRGAAPG